MSLTFMSDIHDLQAQCTLTFQVSYRALWKTFWFDELCRSTFSIFTIATSNLGRTWLLFKGTVSNLSSLRELSFFMGRGVPIYDGRLSNFSTPPPLCTGKNFAHSMHTRKNRIPLCHHPNNSALPLAGLDHLPLIKEIAPLCFLWMRAA